MKRTKVTQDLVNKVHHFKNAGRTAKMVSKELKLPINTVNYILYQKKPVTKTMDELYAEADKAVKEADSTLKRIKRLLFGS